MEIIGEKKADLAMFILKDSYYQKQDCKEEDFTLAISHSYEAANSNAEGKKYEMIIKDVSVMCSEAFLSRFNCSEPVKPMVEYSVKNLNCTDSKGRNPFEHYIKDIGSATNVTAAFTASNMTLTTTKVSSVLDRISEEGCASAPTPSPTKAPHSMIPLWIVTGLAAAAAIVSFIVCCCRNGKQPETETLV